MVACVLDRPDVVVVLDPATGRWRVTVGAFAGTVREWSWGERWRLVDGCVRGAPISATFDRAAFVDGLVDLLVEPTPGYDDRPLVAAVTLRLLGVDPDDRPVPLLAAEAVLVEAWRLGPAELDGQPARRLDQHLAARPRPEPAVAQEVTAGWNTIVVTDG